MKLVFNTDKIAVFDDVIEDKNLFQQIWVAFQNEDFSYPHQNGNWVKVWRLNDGMPLGSQEYHYTKKPYNNYMDVVSHVFAELAKSCEKIVGKDWNEITLRSYIYKSGTKLSWHNDAERYSGAITFYVHPY